MKLTVIFGDNSHLFSDNHQSYRRVTLDLTRDQALVLQKKKVGEISGKNVYESINNCFLEELEEK